jgi:hypothetical protein
VITTGVRYFLTSSITRRQRALNSPAGIDLMVLPQPPWSCTRDHGNASLCQRQRSRARYHGCGCPDVFTRRV